MISPTKTTLGKRKTVHYTIPTKDNGNCAWISLGLQFVRTLVDHESTVISEIESNTQTYRLLLECLQQADLRFHSHLLNAESCRLLNHQDNEVSSQQIIEAFRHIKYYFTSNAQLSDQDQQSLSYAFRLFHYREDSYRQHINLKRFEQKLDQNLEEPIFVKSGSFNYRKKMKIIQESMDNQASKMVTRGRITQLFHARETLIHQWHELTKTSDYHNQYQLVSQSLEHLQESFKHVQESEHHTESHSNCINTKVIRWLQRTQDLLALKISDDLYRSQFIRCDQQDIQPNIPEPQHISNLAEEDHNHSLKRCFWAETVDLKIIALALGFRPIIEFKHKTPHQLSQNAFTEHIKAQISQSQQLVDGLDDTAQQTMWHFIYTESKTCFGLNHQDQAHIEPIITEQEKQLLKQMIPHISTYKLDREKASAPHYPRIETLLTLTRFCLSLIALSLEKCVIKPLREFTDYLPSMGFTYPLKKLKYKFQIINKTTSLTIKKIQKTPYYTRQDKQNTMKTALSNHKPSRVVL